jgi:hypothetical protein
VTDTATCDRCNEAISKADGFLVYSETITGLPGTLRETGNMLLCQACINEILTVDNFTKVFPEEQPLPADVINDLAKLRHAMRGANTASVVDLCKQRGLSLEQAQTKARELAQAWWEDRTRGARDAASFWKPGSFILSDEEEVTRNAVEVSMNALFGPIPGVATASAPKASHVHPAQKKPWWKFW